MLFVGFISAHVLDMLLYHPDRVLTHPWSVLFFWEGIGSFSGFIGALAGVVMWRHFDWQSRVVGPWTIGPLRLGPYTLSRLLRRPGGLSPAPMLGRLGSVLLTFAGSPKSCTADHCAPVRVAK